MDDKKPIQLNEQSVSSSNELNIRTMREDIEKLKQGGGQSKTIEPPKNLPTSAPTAGLRQKLEQRKEEINKDARKEATKMALEDSMKEVDDIRDSFKKEEKEEKTSISLPKRPDLFPKKPESKAPSFLEELKPEVEMPEPIEKSFSEPPVAPKPIIPKPIIPKPITPKPILSPAPAPKPISKKSRSGIYLILLIIIILGGAGGFLYWWNYIREPAVHYKCENLQCVKIEREGISQCQISNDCIPPEPIKPNSLISAEKTEIIEIEPYQENIFSSILKRSALEQKEKGSLSRILIKKVSEQKEKKYASLTEFINLLGIDIPLGLRANFEGNYTLFVYVPEMEEYYKCQDANIADSGCYGPRLGLVIKLSNKAKAIEELEKWEADMVNDLRELILAEISIADDSVGFQSDSNIKYQEANVRYQNLSISPIALNYGFVNDLLVIGTSKNGLYTPLDKLINE